MVVRYRDDSWKTAAYTTEEYTVAETITAAVRATEADATALEEEGITANTSGMGGAHGGQGYPPNTSHT